MAVLQNDVLVGPVTPAAGVTTISLDFDGTGWEASWLEVYRTGSETPLVLGSDYSVSGAGTVSAVVTLSVPANGTDAYSVFLVTPLERSSDMQFRGEFKSEPFNIEMDRIWQRLQLHWTHITRSLRLSATSAMNTILSTVSPGQLIQMRSDGAGFVGYDPNITISEVAVWYQQRSVATAAAATALDDGYVVSIAGLLYEVDSSAAGSASATNDLGENGLVPHGVGYPEHYGALGNGVAIDTSALQAWAQSAGALALKPGSTYLVGDTIVVAAGKWIAGNRATVKAGGLFDLFDFEDGGGIRSARLIGASGAGIYAIDGRGVVARGTNNHPAAPTYITAPDVIDCEISGFGGYGVYFAYCKTGKVALNRIYDCGYTGVGGISCEDVAVHNNIIEDITPGSAGGDAYGSFIDRANGLSETSDPRSYRCSISHNIINRVTATGNNGQAIDTHAGIDFMICGNVIGQCQRGIFITSSVIGALGQQLGPKRVVVDGNIISGDTGYGIIVNGANVSAVVSDWAEDCVISNNIVNGMGFANDAGTGAVQFQFTKGLVMSGNTVKNARSNAVLLNLQNIAFNVSGNVFIDPWDDTYASPNCIRVGGLDARGFIGGNTFRHENAGLGTYVARHALRIEAGLTGLDIECGNNSCVGIDATHLSAVALTTTGVNLSGFNRRNGTVDVTISVAGTEGLTAVVFDKPMPYPPKIKLNEPFQSGTREPIRFFPGEVTAAGFTAYIEPSMLRNRTTGAGTDPVLRQDLERTFATTKTITLEWEAI